MVFKHKTPNSLVQGSRREIWRQITLFLTLFTLLLTTAWIYWPGIAGPELLDDRSSLRALAELQEHPERAGDLVFGDRSGPLGRTVSMASFVVERLYLDDGVRGSKKVNIVLHLFNGCLVMACAWLLFGRIQVRSYRALSVLLGTMWLLHPLLVSTVLYVVQRMAMLATLFMLLSMFAYLRWRFSLVASGSKRLFAVFPALLWFLMAMLSKENAVVLLPILVLLDMFWLRCEDAAGNSIVWLRKTHYTLMAVGGSALVLLLALFWNVISGRYIGRPFDLLGRLLTQARILWDYLAQWFMPDVGRMGLYHDDVVWSTSLTEPITTLYAVLAWLLVLVSTVFLLRWYWSRLLVFCAAFFIIGHLIESTVWPLELYFEHRNYFPAIGLVLGVGVIYGALVKIWPETASPLLVALGCVVVALSALTSSHVQMWSSQPLLILNHLNGHPNSPRANIDMAVQLAHLGSVDTAYRYSARAYEASHTEREGDWAVRDLALSCTANQSVTNAQIDKIGEGGNKRPLGSVTTLLSLVRMLQDNRCASFDRIYFADHMQQVFLRENAEATASTNMYSNLAVLENALERYEPALGYTQKLLALDPSHKRGLLMALHFATAVGDEEAANRVIVTLQAMNQKGKLTVAQQQTLALYLEK